MGFGFKVVKINKSTLKCKLIRLYRKTYCMKPILIGLLCFPLSLLAQQSLTIDQEQLIYRYVPNPIRIHHCDSSLSLKAKYGQVYKKNGKWWWIWSKGEARGRSSMDQLYLGKWVGADFTIIDSLKYRPSYVYSELLNVKVTNRNRWVLRDLTDTLRLRITPKRIIKHLPLDSITRVHSFDVIADYKNGTLDTIPVQGDYFSLWEYISCYSFETELILTNIHIRHDFPLKPKENKGYLMKDKEIHLYVGDYPKYH